MRPIVATTVHPSRQVVNAQLGEEAVIVRIGNHTGVAYQDIALHPDRKRAIDDGSAPEQDAIGKIDPALVPLGHDLTLDQAMGADIDLRSGRPAIN